MKMSEWLNFFYFILNENKSYLDIYFYKILYTNNLIKHFFYDKI